MNSAIDTGIHVLAVAILRVMQYFEIAFGNVYHFDGNTEPGGGGERVRRPARLYRLVPFEDESRLPGSPAGVGEAESSVEV